MAVKPTRGAPVLFRYKAGNSFLHTAPSWLKIVLLFPLSVGTLYLSAVPVIAFIVCMAILAFACGFHLCEQLRDLRFAVFYAVFLYAIAVFTNYVAAQSWTPELFIPDMKWLSGSARLMLMLQISTLLFRTTTSIEMKYGLDTLEHAVRALLRRIPVFGRHISAQSRFAASIALFIGFIPAVFELWQKIECAWTARGGKNGVAKIKTLTPVLISLCFYAAAAKARAIASRQ